MIEKPGFSWMNVCSFFMSLVWLKGTLETHSDLLKAVFIKKFSACYFGEGGNATAFCYLSGESLILVSSLVML